MAAAGMTLLAMTQPSLLKYMSPRETDDDVEPTIQTMGFWNYASYVFLAMMILHTVYYFLDAFMLANIQLTIFSSVLSALLATVLVLGIDMLTTTSKRN
jgi:cytosine/uracil/thiamine/allantoin permease